MKKHTNESIRRKALYEIHEQLLFVEKQNEVESKIKEYIGIARLLEQASFFSQALSEGPEALRICCAGLMVYEMDRMPDILSLTEWLEVVIGGILKLRRQGVIFSREDWVCMADATLMNLVEQFRRIIESGTLSDQAASYR